MDNNRNMNQEAVSNWLDLAGKQEGNIPKFPESNDFRLGLALILEELIELAESGDISNVSWFINHMENRLANMQKRIDSGKIEDKESLTELRDALVDLEVVTRNLVHFAGLRDQYQKDFNEVMNSNMSKYCKTLDEAKATVKAYESGTHPDKVGEKIECYHDAVMTSEDDVYYIIKRIPDNKILKSINYNPAKL